MTRIFDDRADTDAHLPHVSLPDLEVVTAVQLRPLTRSWRWSVEGARGGSWVIYVRASTTRCTTQAVYRMFYWRVTILPCT